LKQHKNNLQDEIQNPSLSIFIIIFALLALQLQGSILPPTPKCLGGQILKRIYILYEPSLQLVHDDCFCWVVWVWILMIDNLQSVELRPAALKCILLSGREVYDIEMNAIIVVVIQANEVGDFLI
jgi:hypothetical protein